MALRGEDRQGRMVASPTVAPKLQGDTTYKVLAELEPTRLNLRPGMNVEVEILTG